MVVPPPPPAAGTAAAAAAAQLPREHRNILRAFRAAGVEIPPDLDIDKVKEHLTADEIRLADGIDTMYENKVNQLPVHPGIDNNLTLGNHPLIGAATSMGIEHVWMANKDAGDKTLSVLNLTRLLKSLRYKDHDGNALLQVDVCFTKERVVRGGPGRGHGGRGGGGAGRGGGRGGRGRRHVSLVRENLRISVSNALNAFDFVIRTAEGKPQLVLRDRIEELDPDNPVRKQVERVFETRYTLLLSAPDVFAMLAFPKIPARNFAYGVSKGGTRFSVLVGKVVNAVGGKTGHTGSFGVKIPGIGWICIGPIFNSIIHASPPIGPANPPSQHYRLYVQDTNILVRGGEWFTFALSSVGCRSAFTLKNAGMVGSHVTESSVYAAIHCADLLDETPIMKAFDAASPGDPINVPSVSVPYSLVPGVTSRFIARGRTHQPT